MCKAVIMFRCLRMKNLSCTVWSYLVSTFYLLLVCIFQVTTYYIVFACFPTLNHSMIKDHHMALKNKSSTGIIQRSTVCLILTFASGTALVHWCWMERGGFAQVQLKRMITEFQSPFLKGSYYNTIWGKKWGIIKFN